MVYTSPFDIPDDDPEFQAFKTQFLGTGKEQNGGLAGDLGTGLKIGVEQLPGIVTGLADIALSPVSKMTGVNRPVSRAADWLGEQTGFQPTNWAKQAEQGYSPQYQEAKQNVHDAEGFLPTVGALVRNPRFIAGTVAESLPSMVAGMGIAGVGARAVIGAEKLAALRAAAAAGDGAALTQLGRAGALAGGVGEGVVTAGQQVSQTGYDVDPLLAAGTATAAGIGTGAIGAVSGRLAAKMGISDVDSLAVTGLANRGVTSGAKGIAKNMAKGVFTEGVLEELPQSMQEQIWQNVANGKPWDEGVSEQGAIGMMAGAVMGAGANIAPRSSPKPESKPVADDKEPVNLLSPDAPKGTQGDLFGEGGTQGPLMTPGYNDAPADGNPVPDGVVEMMSDRATLDAFVKENYTTNPDAAAQAIALIDRIDNGLRSITQGAPATDTYANFNPNQGSLDLGFATDTAQESVNLLAPEPTQAPVQDDLVSRWEAALNETQSTQVAQESGQGASGVAGGSAGNTQTQPGVGRGGDNIAATSVLSSGANQLVGNTTGPDGAGVNVTQPTQVATQTQKANDAKVGTKSGTALAAQGVKPGTKGALEAAVTELMPEESTERQDHINAIQTAKSYTSARKALAKMSPQGLKIALRSAPQEEQRVVQTALGWDSQGNQVGSRIASYADVAKASGLNSRQRVQQILKSYGIDADVINRMNAADQQAVAVSELMPSQQEEGGVQEGTGFRVMDTPNASDDIVDDRKTRIETHLANRFAAEQGVTAKDLAQGVETDDTVQTAEEVAREDRIAEAANSQREEMLREVASDYNSDIEGGDAPFERLDTDLQEKYIDAFEDFNEDKISARDLMRIFSEVADEAKARNAVRGGNQNRLEGRTNTSGQLPGLVQSQEAVSEQTQDASRPEQTRSPEGSDGVKQSRGVEGSTQASAIESKLKPLFFSSSRFSNRVVVVQSAAALPQNLQSSIDGNTQAFVQGGKVYMIADNIAEGKELAVFLHEVGVHLGMKGLIGQENLNRLAMQIKRWAVKNDGSVESELAKKALSRVKSAQQGGVDMELGDVIEERVAYFVEEAVNAGINPTALSKSGGPLQQWFTSFMKALRAALVKFGFSGVESLNAQNIVDLAYGAANIQLGEDAVETTASIKFSKSSNIAQTNPQYRKTSTLVRQTLEYLGNKFQSVENNTMFGHQLAQKAEQLMPGTSRYFKSLIQRQTERVKHEQEIARIANRYNELETRDQNALNAFVQKSTMDGKWGFKPTWFEKDVQTPVDQTMKTEFDKLTPAAQQIAKDMFKFGSEQQKRFDTSVNANITDPKKKVQRNQMYGKPYAPLKRFGDHVVVGKSAEFVAEEKAHPGSKRLEEMKADENHYYVEFVDGNWESIKRRDEMAATNPNMTWDSKPLQLENRALNSVNMTILEKLKNQIEASDNKSADATKGALKSLANQLYIQQLNQMHANKSQAKRLKVKGAEADMMKAFVSQGRAEAALIANLMTHAESEAGLQQIQTAARTGDNQDAKTRVANAVLRRHLAMLDFQPTPIQNKLMGANSFMMLLTSPAYYLTNATQPFVVSMPYMAGRFGGANSWNTLRDAYKTTLELVKLSTLFKDQNLDAAHLKKFNSVGREAEALQVLLDENLVNVGMEMELGDIASQSKNPAMKNLQKGLQVLKTGVANVEVLNRLSTAVAAYRLTYAEALNKGSSKDAAHEAGTSYARQTIIDTHGDYAGYNAPTVMMQGAFGSMPVKLMTQFKKFQFIQAGLLIGTFRDAYLRGNLNENEKAAAKAMFKWMLGTQAALAGALGGVTGVPMALLGAMMAGIFGDDGEDKEAFLRRILGGGAFAQLILHGVPAAAGVDISKRVGMGAALDPFRMADPQTDWSDYALSLAGPSAGLASRTASGLNYIGKGQYWKGLEMLMPSGILTNASKIARYEAEGLTNSRGDVVMKPEEISLMTDLMQGLGLETTQLSDRRWKAGAIYDRGIHFKEKTSQLQRQYVDAFKDGDQEELAAIRQEWMKLQAERVNQGFKRENMTALTQAPMAQKKRERETVSGLQTTQTNRKFVESMDAL